MIGFWETLIITGIIILVFGVGKLPTVMGDVGRAIRVFKDEIKGEPASPSQAASPPQASADRSDRPG